GAAIAGHLNFHDPESQSDEGPGAGGRLGPQRPGPPICPPPPTGVTTAAHVADPAGARRRAPPRPPRKHGVRAHAADEAHLPALPPERTADRHGGVGGAAARAADAHAVSLPP